MRNSLFERAHLWSGFVAVFAALVPAIVFAQQPGTTPAPTPDTPTLTPSEKPEAIPFARPSQATGGIMTQRFHAVHLRVDGNLAGRVSVINASGELVPAQATIVFVRDGRVVASVRSDEMGHFQVVRLQPGIYSVVAINGRSVTGDGREYVGAFSVKVLAYDPTVPPERELLHVALIPVEDLIGLLPEQVPVSEAAVPCVPPCARGGGGGEGLGALLGLGGLAGLAALAQEEAVASPYQP